MRVWDIDPKYLCRKHLLGEHRELHAIYTILSTGKSGYRNQPETKRWVGKLKALHTRHEALVKEMQARNYNHASPLNETHAIGESVQKDFVDTPKRQKEILREKGCECRV